MLNAYMIYSRAAGPEEGAALVFAHTVREARKIGYPGIGNDLTGDEYIDLAADLIRNSPYLFQEADPDKLARDVPHVIDNPRSCDRCERWGQSAIGEDCLCDICKSDKELERIVEVLYSNAAT